MGEVTYILEVTTNASETFTYSFTSEVSYCSVGDDFSGENGTLDITDFEITNLGQGDDEEWELLDEIEIEIEIENNDNDDDVDDVIVEIMILDENDEDVTNDFDFDDESIDLGRINDDDSEVAVFKINEVPADLEGTYRIYFRAYSEDDESSHCIASSTSDFNEDNYHVIEVVTLGNRAVIVKPEWKDVLASCGDNNVEVALDVYNLGEDKEEKILVNLYSSILGIDEKIIVNDLRSGKRQEVVFVFDVPEGLTNSYYNIEVTTYYDYDDDEDELLISSYGESSYNDLDKDFAVKLDILSCRGPDPTVNANLESIAEVGNELTIKSIITNNGEDNDFVISLSDFENWATLISISPQTASINKGEFVEVTIVLKPTVSGIQSFNINAIVDGESYDQAVSVNIAENPSFFAKINNAMGSNAIFYISMGIAGLLIAIVSILIVKISRRKVSPQF